MIALDMLKFLHVISQKFAVSSMNYNFRKKQKVINSQNSNVLYHELISFEIVICCGPALNTFKHHVNKN